MEKLVCVQDFAEAASETLEKNKSDYVKTGADDEITLKDNCEAFNRWLIRPRVLRDVSQRSIESIVLGRTLKVPIGVCPMGFQRTMHPDGEVAVAKAAASVGSIFTLSMFATSSIEEIAAAAPNGRNWLQLFIHKDREITKGLIRRAEKAGFEAIVVTIDAQYVGKRRVSKRTSFTFPEHLRLANVAPNTSAKSLDMSQLHSVLDFGLTWEIVGFLKKITHLPIVLKGVYCPEDALLAVQNGADAIIVSNHGGRQIDTAPATIDALPSVVKAVNGKAEVYIDSGVRKGSDVFKALALGAKVAFMGRPHIWGLAVGGEHGARRVMEIVRDELDLTMALSGTANIKDISSDCIINVGTFRSKL